MLAVNFTLLYSVVISAEFVPFTFGPLIRSWCIRFEEKHHEFKRLSIFMGNYINLPYSLTKRHQEGICYKHPMAVCHRL